MNEQEQPVGMGGTQAIPLFDGGLKETAPATPEAQDKAETAPREKK